ncbi:unnamed protein product [Didymodactylos carnosus]|uniref:Uncharacterized protein n=1 Tax=Didymodactylos carnosus TaxID=1234261 RepID=A0A8S2N7F5_9BILA|nr:unnamed protein product [Didymodactylos carnosus]CAF3984935.1 unnamed protein product [Didymodactylos carnosus]
MLMMGNGKDDDSIYPFMAGEQVLGTIIGLLYMLLHKVKLLTVKGDFGSVSWVLEKDKSRDVCSKLPELIYQLKGQRY